jgi:hypothetical protein
MTTHTILNTKTSRSQNPHGLIPQHDLPSRLARQVSEAGEPGRARGGLAGERDPGIATEAN